MNTPNNFRAHPKQKFFLKVNKIVAVSDLHLNDIDNVDTLCLDGTQMFVDFGVPSIYNYSNLLDGEKPRADTAKVPIFFKSIQRDITTGNPEAPVISFKNTNLVASASDLIEVPNFFEQYLKIRLLQADLMVNVDPADDEFSTPATWNYALTQVNITNSIFISFTIYVKKHSKEFN